MTHSPLGNPDRHFYMTRGVARVMNISLTEAIAEGRLSADRYAAMITRCRSCALVEACEDWLAHTPRSASPPPGCCHAPLLQSLRRVQHG